MLFEFKIRAEKGFAIKYKQNPAKKFFLMFYLKLKKRKRERESKEEKEKFIYKFSLILYQNIINMRFKNRC